QTRDLAEGFGTGRQRGADRRERVRPRLHVRAAAEVVVDGVHLVTLAGELHRGRPPEVTVAAEDQDPHAGASLRVRWEVGQARHPSNAARATGVCRATPGSRAPRAPGPPRP